MTINEVILCGRLTDDPELRYTQNNKAVCRFRLAVDRYNGEGQENTTDFIPCTSWGGQAEHISRYYFKGKKAIVKGNLRTFTWQDQQGQTRYGWEVVVEKIDFADDKKAGNQGAVQQGGQYQQPQHHQSHNAPPQQNYQNSPSQSSQSAGGYRAPQNPPPPPPAMPQNNQQVPMYPWETA